VSYELSRKEAQAEKSPSAKIERLIDEAKRARTETDLSRTQEPKSNEEAKTQGEMPTTRRTLREEILVTLNETSKELSRIIGVLMGEREAPPTESRILLDTAPTAAVTFSQTLCTAIDVEPASRVSN